MNKLPIEEPEAYLPWYKKEYTLKEYVKLVTDYCHSEYDSSSCSLYHEMKYAMQNIRSENAGD